QQARGSARPCRGWGRWRRRPAARGRRRPAARRARAGRPPPDHLGIWDGAPGARTRRGRCATTGGSVEAPSSSLLGEKILRVLALSGGGLGGAVGDVVAMLGLEDSLRRVLIPQPWESPG